MEALLAHLVGDYLLQSDWMALEKYKKLWIAFVHGFFYTLPFLFVTQSPAALALIYVSHALIDHYKVAAKIVWVKNWLALTDTCPGNSATPQDMTVLDPCGSPFGFSSSGTTHPPVDQLLGDQIPLKQGDPTDGVENIEP